MFRRCLLLLNIVVHTCTWTPIVSYLELWPTEIVDNIRTDRNENVIVAVCQDSERSEKFQVRSYYSFSLSLSLSLSSLSLSLYTVHYNSLVQCAYAKEIEDWKLPLVGAGKTNQPTLCLPISVFDRSEWVRRQVALPMSTSFLRRSLRGWFEVGQLAKVIPTSSKNHRIASALKMTFIHFRQTAFKLTLCGT